MFRWVRYIQYVELKDFVITLGLIEKPVEPARFWLDLSLLSSTILFLVTHSKTLPVAPYSSKESKKDFDRDWQGSHFDAG